MNPDVQREFDLLQVELGALGYRLSEYRYLYGSTPERFNFLHSIAPVFFNLMFETLWGDMLMHLTRVTGPALTRVGKVVHNNLSLKRLQNLMGSECPESVTAAIGAAGEAAKFAEPARNKIYAHRDVIVAKDGKALGEQQLGSVDEMVKALGLCEAALDAVAAYYVGTNRATYWHHVGWGIAADMVRVLEAGDRALQAEAMARRPHQRQEGSVLTTTEPRTIARVAPIAKPPGGSARKG